MDSSSFREMDLVLWLIQRTAGQHKLATPWEGSFVIRKVIGNNLYYLIDMGEYDKSITSKEKKSKGSWNIKLLRPFST
jgi:hypothetical protein